MKNPARYNIAATRVLFTVGTLGGLTAPIAVADISGVGGHAVIAAPPANIQLGQWPSDTEARVWAERSVVLTSPLAVDAVNAGVVWDNGAGNTPGVLPAGTTVAFTMLRTESVGNHSIAFAGFVTFDEPIIGLVFLEATLNGTDALAGRPGVIYNQNNLRGVDAGEADRLELSADRRRLDFSFQTGSKSDDVRIVTAVPAPASTLLLPACGLLAARRRRR